MSSTTASSSVERSELQIRTLLGEITQLSKRDVSPEEFHAEFLRSVTAALGAVGAGLWILENGTLTLAYQINFKELRLQENDTEKHTRLLTRLLNSPDTGTLLPPHSGSEGDDEAGNPTEHLLICCPIRTELEIVGLVEIIHRADAPVAIQRNFVQFLAQTCRYGTIEATIRNTVPARCWCGSNLSSTTTSKKKPPGSGRQFSTDHRQKSFVLNG